MFLPRFQARHNQIDKPVQKWLSWTDRNSGGAYEEVVNYQVQAKIRTL